ELARFAGSGHPCSVLSEEAGAIDLGAEYPRVVLDPVDGSLNAKQGLPLAAVMLSLLEGPSVGHIRLGWVRKLVSGESWARVWGAAASTAMGAPSPGCAPGAGRAASACSESRAHHVTSARFNH